MELFRALAVLAEPPRPEAASMVRLLELGEPPDRGTYTQLFLFELSPYASVYLGEEGMLGGEARDRIAGFWRALGQDPPAEPDHLAAVLACYARLAELEAEQTVSQRRAALRRARSAFLWEHMVSWLPPYLCKVTDIAPTPYRAWAGLLTDAISQEARTVGLPEAQPVHLRLAPPMPDPSAVDSEEFLTALLAPVRSGVILTRSDVGRAARVLGLGLRAGERLYALKALFDQAPREMCRWLEGESKGWCARHAAMESAFGPVIGHWTERARSTARAVGGFPGPAGRSGTEPAAVQNAE
jgi:TorA maturation chaperone TorD